MRGRLLLLIQCMWWFSAQAQFIRNLDVPVIDHNVELENPWAGGLNSAQFSTIDLNFDGLEDLFVFDRIGNRICTFLKVQDQFGQFSYKYTHAYNSAFPDGLANWVLLRDFNCDGKKDIFTSFQSGLKIWKNTGSASGLSFEPVNNGNFIEATFNFGSPFVAPVYVIAPDMPSVVDYDDDGDMDIFTYTELSTTVYFFKCMQVENGNCEAPSYLCANRCYGKFGEASESFSIYSGNEFNCDFNVVNPRSENDRLHTGSTLLNIDLDHNGVKDLIVGDVTENNLIDLEMVDTFNGQDSVVQFHSNFPYAYGASDSVHFKLFPAAYYEDVTGDGVKDLLSSSNAVAQAEDRTSVLFFKNEGANDQPSFNFVQNDFLQAGMIELGLCAYPTLVDFDGDTLLDLIVTNQLAFSATESYTSKMAFYKNTGTATDPEFTLIDNNFLGFPSFAWKSTYVTFGDLDGDADNDMIVGDLDGKLHYFLNLASPGAAPAYSLNQVELVDNLGSAIDVGQSATPQLIDLDGDNLLDLAVGEKNGNINYYHNVGTENNFSFALEDDSLGDVIAVSYLNVDGFSVPHFYRNTSTNALELLLGCETGIINRYTNIEGNLTGTFTLTTEDYGGFRDGDRSAITTGDLNNDGLLDAIYGQIGGGLALFMADPNYVEPHENPTLDFTIFPNPAHGSVTIQWPSTSGFSTLTIYDPTGRMLDRYSTSNTQETFSTSQMPSGVYLIKLETDGGSAVKRLVVY